MSWHRPLSRITRPLPAVEADLGPRHARRRMPGTLPLVAALAAVTIPAGLWLGSAAPGWLDADRPAGASTPSASAPTPSYSPGRSSQPPLRPPFLRRPGGVVAPLSASPAPPRTREARRPSPPRTRTRSPSVTPTPGVSSPPLLPDPPSGSPSPTPELGRVSRTPEACVSAVRALVKAITEGGAP
jgi:hypothetical protein